MADLGDNIVKKDLAMDDSGELRGTYVTGAYAGAGACADGFEEENSSEAKAAAYAGAGVGRVQIKRGDGVLSVNGPTVGAGAEASSQRLRAVVKAEVGSVSTSLGKLKSTVGLAADTGVGISQSGVEVKFLGTGISIGRKMGISLFGSGLEFEF